jgi:hypothetical protein
MLSGGHQERYKRIDAPHDVMAPRQQPGRRLSRRSLALAYAAWRCHAECAIAHPNGVGAAYHLLAAISVADGLTLG